MQIGSVEALKAQMEKCIISDCKDCPYADAQICDTAMTKDALEYIESLEERIAIMQESMETLEKRNEPVTPVREIGSYSQIFRCRNCDALMVFQKQKYCHECGQAVKWE